MANTNDDLARHDWDRIVTKVREVVVANLGTNKPLPSGFDIDDVMQSVLLEVFLKVDTFTPQHGQAARSWFATIARNKTRDLWRRQAVRGDSTPLDESIHAVDVTASVGNVLELQEMHERKRLAEDGLSSRHRRALVLREERGMDYERIASELGLPNGRTARNLFSYARRKRAQNMRLHYGSWG